MTPIPNYPKYSADVYGNIYGTKGPLKPQKHTGGYKMVQLPHKNGFKSRYIHRLIWQTFKGPIPNGNQINHLDGNKSNNALQNLELVSAKSNTRHAIKHGLRGLKRKNLNPKEVVLIRDMLAKNISTAKIALTFNRSQRCIQHIASGKRRVKRRH